MRAVVALLFAGLFAGIPAFGQGTSSPPSSQSLITTADPQAVAVLAQALSATGGAPALAQIQDFSASGTITYFWAGTKVQGTATVRGLAPYDFRLDANLPAGTRSYAISHGVGSLQSPDGKITAIPGEDTINTGILTLPLLTLYAQLKDSSTGTKYAGLVSDASSGQLIDVRVERNFSAASDPQNVLARQCVTDYFIDPHTYLLVKAVDTTHSEENPGKSYPREIDFQNYVSVNGVNVPMFVREKIDGQTTWELTLSTVTFNNGLADSDFQLQ